MKRSGIWTAPTDSRTTGEICGRNRRSSAKGILEAAASWLGRPFATTTSSVWPLSRTRWRAQTNTAVLERHLMPYLRQTRCRRSNVRIFQQDNARIHVSAQSKQWFEANRVNVLDWPACSPDLNPIENLWGYLARKVYAENRQFANVSNLQYALEEEFKKLDSNYLKSLSNSMPNRIYQLIQNNGRALNY